MDLKENTYNLLGVLILSFIVAYFAGSEAYEVADVKNNGSVATCRVVHDPNCVQWGTKVLLNGENVHLSRSMFSDYKENDEVEVLWKKNEDKNVVVPKDCSYFSIVLPSLVFALIIVASLIGIFCEIVGEVVLIFLAGVMVLLTLSFYTLRAFTAFDLKNTGCVATAKVVYEPSFFSKASYRVLVNGEEKTIIKGVLGSYDENEELEVYGKKDYDEVVPKNHVVSTVISYGFLPMFFIVCLLIILYCAIWDKIRNRT